MPLFGFFRRRVPTPTPQPAATEVLERLDSIERRWLAWKVEADSLLSGFVDALDEIEHKRRQITSAAARIDGKKASQAAQDAPGDAQLALLDPAAARAGGKAAVMHLLRAQGKA